MRHRNRVVLILEGLLPLLLLVGSSSPAALANPLPSPGPCCFPSGECLMLGIDECYAQGGQWLGEELECDPNPCWGACCTESGACVVRNYFDCVTPMGRFLGPWTSCENDPCSVGACCLADGSCVMLHPQECVGQGGTFTYEGYPCAFDPCDVSGEAGAAPGRVALVAAPNPFVAGTVLTLSVPSGRSLETAVCRILDASGRVVAVIPAEPRGAGAVGFSWVGRDEAGRPVSSGAYFARVRSGAAEANAVVLRLR